MGPHIVVTEKATRFLEKLGALLKIEKKEWSLKELRKALKASLASLPEGKLKSSLANVDGCMEILRRVVLEATGQGLPARKPDNVARPNLTSQQETTGDLLTDDAFSAAVTAGQADLKAAVAARLPPHLPLVHGLAEADVRASGREGAGTLEDSIALGRSALRICALVPSHTHPTAQNGNETMSSFQCVLGAIRAGLAAIKERPAPATVMGGNDGNELAPAWSAEAQLAALNALALDTVAAVSTHRRRVGVLRGRATPWISTLPPPPPAGASGTSASDNADTATDPFLSGLPPYSGGERAPSFWGDDTLVAELLLLLARIQAEMSPSPSSLASSKKSIAGSVLPKSTSMGSSTAAGASAGAGVRQAVLALGGHACEPLLDCLAAAPASGKQALEPGLVAALARAVLLSAMSTLPPVTTTSSSTQGVTGGGSGAGSGPGTSGGASSGLRLAVLYLKQVAVARRLRQMLRDKGDRDGAQWLHAAVDRRIPAPRQLYAAMVQGMGPLAPVVDKALAAEDDEEPRSIFARLLHASDQGFMAILSAAMALARKEAARGQGAGAAGTGAGEAGGDVGPADLGDNEVVFFEDRGGAAGGRGGTQGSDGEDEGGAPPPLADIGGEVLRAAGVPSREEEEVIVYTRAKHSTRDALERAGRKSANQKGGSKRAVADEDVDDAVVGQIAAGGGSNPCDGDERASKKKKKGEVAAHGSTGVTGGKGGRRPMANKAASESGSEGSEPDASMSSADELGGEDDDAIGDAGASVAAQAGSAPGSRLRVGGDDDGGDDIDGDGDDGEELEEEEVDGEDGGDGLAGGELMAAAAGDEPTGGAEAEWPKSAKKRGRGAAEEDKDFIEEDVEETQKKPKKTPAKASGKAATMMPAKALAKTPGKTPGKRKAKDAALGGQAGEAGGGGDEGGDRGDAKGPAAKPALPRISPMHTRRGTVVGASAKKK